MLRACFMRLTCHAINMSCLMHIRQKDTKVYRRRHSFWISRPQYIGTPAALYLHLPCSSTLYSTYGQKCCTHVVSHVICIMLHTCNMYGKHSKSYMQTCMYNITRHACIKAACNHQQSSCHRANCFIF